MRKLKVRFCERNLKDEKSYYVKDHLENHYSDMVDIEEFRCLSNCSICNQGPYCTINDFLFNNKTPTKLINDLDKLLTDLKKEIDSHLKTNSK